MKTKIFAICSLWLLFSLLSCDRKLIDQGIATEASNDVLVREAQTYFQTLNSQRARISSYDIPLPKEWLDNRIPQWAQAVTFTRDEKNVVEVPLLYNNIDPVYTVKSEALGAQAEITQRNGVTKALFFKHKDGSIAIYIMKLILDPAYLAKVKANNQYKNLSFNTVNQDFSGVMLLSSWNEKLLDMYVFKDGKIKSRTRPRTGNTAVGARMRQCYYNPRCDFVCVGFSSNCCTPEDEAYNPTGWCCNESFKSCTYQCIYDEVCYPDDNPTEPSGDNTPYNPGNSSDNAVTTADITVDPNLNLCFKNIISSVTTDRYKSYLLKRTKEVFGDNGGATNLTFKSGTAGGSLGAYRGEEKTIYLDGSKLANQSDEWVATVLFHEITHAIIVEYRGNFMAPSTYDQHKEIFSGWVTNMRDALKEVYPNLTDTEALSLALQGMDDYIRDQNNHIRPEVDRAAREKFGISLADASSNATPYSSGTKGKKCNQ